MKISNRSFRLLSSSLLAAATIVAALGASAGLASAARPRPTAIPTTVPTPYVYPTPGPTPVSPISPSVPVPLTSQATYIRPDNYSVQIAPATQLGDAEFVSGPNTAPRPVVSLPGGGIDGPTIVSVFDNGGVAFSRLVENSDYVFRYRNKIYVSQTTNSLYFVLSPWVQFSFHTPTGDSLRPAAPQNLRVTERTATTVTVRWDPVPTAVRYNFSLNGGAPTQTGVCSGAYCTPPDPLTATFPRPAPGANVLFSVTATRAPDPYCGPYCFPDTRFDTSLPATLVITN